MPGGGGAGTLASGGLFSQALGNGAAASGVQKTSSVGYPASAGTVNLLNYSYGAA